MILKHSDSIEINQQIIIDTLDYTHRYICMNITKKMIPDIFGIVSFGYDDDNFQIKLKDNVTINFSDDELAIQVFEILSSDFENVDIYEKYPELKL